MTTAETATPTLAELAERYAETRAAAREITHTITRAALELSNRNLINDCRKIGEVNTALRAEFGTTLTSLEVATEIHLRRTLEGEMGGVIAEAITGYDELYDVLVELGGFVDDLVGALDGKFDDEPVSDDYGPDRPTLSRLLAAHAPVDEDDET